MPMLKSTLNGSFAIQLWDSHDVTKTDEKTPEKKDLKQCWYMNVND